MVVSFITGMLFIFDASETIGTYGLTTSTSFFNVSWEKVLLTIPRIKNRPISEKYRMVFIIARFNYWSF
jgi:hypothetical protein